MKILKTLSQETWENYQSINKEKKVKSTELDEIIKKIDEILGKIFNQEVLSYRDSSLINSQVDLLNDSHNFLAKSMVRMNMHREILNRMSMMENIYKILIDGLREEIKELESLQYTAKSLLNRCMDSTAHL